MTAAELSELADALQVNVDYLRALARAGLLPRPWRPPPGPHSPDGEEGA